MQTKKRLSFLIAPLHYPKDLSLEEKTMQTAYSTVPTRDGRGFSGASGCTTAKSTISKRYASSVATIHGA